MGKLVIDGNSVYEIDEECLRRREHKERRQNDNAPGYVPEKRAGTRDGKRK